MSKKLSEEAYALYRTIWEQRLHPSPSPAAEKEPEQAPSEAA